MALQHPTQAPYLMPSRGKNSSHSNTNSHANSDSHVNSNHHPNNNSFANMKLSLPLLSANAMIHNPNRDAMLCRYPSKLCDNQRSEKRGGGLHRFCAYHRERANVNQRRVDHRRRLRRQGKPVPPAEHSREWHYGSDMDSDVRSEESYGEVKFDLVDIAHTTLPEFSESELHELLELLEDVDAVPSELSIKEEPMHV